MNRGDASNNNTNTPTVLSISWTESAAFYSVCSQVFYVKLVVVRQLWQIKKKTDIAPVKRHQKLAASVRSFFSQMNM